MRETQADVVSLTKFRARSDRAKWRRKYGRHQAAIEMGASEEQALRSVYESEAHDVAHMATVGRLWCVVLWIVFCVFVWLVGALAIMAGNS